MWNAPVMMEFKHNTGLRESIGVITEDAPHRQQNHNSQFNRSKRGQLGMLLCSWKIRMMMLLTPIYRTNGKILRYSKAVLPISRQNGIQIYEYHQIEKISGNSVTFKEPIMHAINKDWGWNVHKFANYANVGVEDLTFQRTCQREVYSSRL